MFLFSFVRALSRDIGQGKVIKSKWATVGPYHEAVNGSSYVVFDDVNKEMIKCKGPFSAAKTWHEINYKQIYTSYQHGGA